MFRKTCDAMASTLVICLDLFALSFFSLSMTKTRLILVILSPLALDQLTRLNVEYPMLFELTNKSERQTHAGVLEFIANKGKIQFRFGWCVIWYWKKMIWSQMRIVHCHILKMSILERGLLGITNPRAMLWNCLWNFACLTSVNFVAINLILQNYLQLPKIIYF